MRYQINLRELTEILKKDKWLIFSGTILITLLLVMSSLLLIQPKYSSTVQLVGVPNVTNPNEINANILSVTTFKDFTKSSVVLNTVADELGKSAPSLKELKNNIEVKQSPDSQMFSIQIMAPTAAKADAIANKTAIIFKQKAKEILKNDSIEIVSPAGTDTYKVAPNSKLMILLGGLIGLVIMILFSLVKDFFNGTIKSEQYIEEAFNVVPIGSVSKIDPKIMRRISHLELNKSIHLGYKNE